MVTIPGGDDSSDEGEVEIPKTRTAGIRLAEFSDKLWVQVTGQVDEEALDKRIERLIGRLYWET